MKLGILSITALAFLSACSPKPSAHKEQVKAINQFEISDARIRIPPNGTTTTALYFNIKNNSENPIHIIGLTSNISSRLELHSHETDANGMMQMREADEFVVPAHETLSLAPMGKHIMVFDTKGGQKEGQKAHFYVYTKEKLKIEFDATFVTNPEMNMENMDKSMHDGH